MLFHSVFSIVILVSAVFLWRWRKDTKRKGAVATIGCFLFLQIPVYIALFYSAARAAASEDRSLFFGIAGIVWATSLVVLMHGIKALLDDAGSCPPEKKGPGAPPQTDGGETPPPASKL